MPFPYVLVACEMIHVTNAKGSRTDYLTETVALGCYTNFNFKKGDVFQVLVTAFGEYNNH